MKGLLLITLAAAGLAAPLTKEPEKAKRVYEGVSWIVPAGQEGDAAEAEKAKRVYEGISWIVPAGQEGEAAEAEKA
ncbi:uncharacterized protein BCR38DRAFT_422073 [Pseudomassariella vexata]|uniref:Uncharacterized protein n=1 Tax=Pseudomassariella vexata TaxID=1141098 RepID=A0A1Y2EFQ7_9PEZI|nr:uncharacterized protein BCR38DRAFT_422073 [Pseudomassariella vexata]ORY70413.1 hypothetical protein BCR38DRAFT_422073 [Pseudomassariella vexata]